jgi:hypothetical protein
LQVWLDILVRGWEHPGWRGDFYPEDLPSDWRLTYFANEFPALMIPADRWLGVSEARLRDWARDVPAGFRFYLEAPRAGGDGGDAVRVGRLLAARLAGLVAETALPGRALRGPVPVYRLWDDLGAARPHSAPIALRVRGTEIRDLRVARARLEALAGAVGDGCGLLLLDGGDVGADDLRRWWALARLLGFA